MKISFGNLTWQINPTELKVKLIKEISEAAILGSGKKFVGVVKGLKRANGKGYFIGENAKEKYRELEKLFTDETRDFLFLPGQDGFLAELTGLSYIGINSEDSLVYEFEFTEVCENEKRDNEFIIAKGGESLWDISFDCGKSIKSLAEKNPHIRYISNIQKGEVVYL